MITRWLKENRLLLAFVVVFVTALGALSWYLWGKSDTYKQTKTNLVEKLTQLELLLNNNPIPTTTNLKCAIVNCTRLKEALHELQRFVICTNGFSSYDSKFASSNIELAQHLRKEVAKMEGDMEKAKIVIPKDFRFGFKRYATTVPQKNLPPVMLEHLGKQLIVVRRLTAIMIKSGVEQINAIKRVEVEPVPAGLALSEDALPDLLVSHPQEHYISMPFELQFACSAKSLQALLNNIATADTFFIVRLVTMEQEVLQKNTDATEAPEGPVASPSKQPKNWQRPIVRRG